jgi:uncharacterized Zn ribbon protein
MIVCPRCEVELEYVEEDDVYVCPECPYTVPADLVDSEDPEGEEVYDEDEEE